MKRFAMFRTLLVAAVSASTVCLCRSENLDTDFFRGQPVVANEVLFRFASGTPGDEINHALSQIPLQGDGYRLPAPLINYGRVLQHGPQWYVTEAKSPRPIRTALNDVLHAAPPGTIIVEPDYILTSANSIGQGPFAENAADLAYLGPLTSTIVAVLDTGVLPNHKRIAATLWHPALNFCTSIEGRWIQTLAFPLANYGFDASKAVPPLESVPLNDTISDPNYFAPRDETGHGTHCASLVADFSEAPNPAFSIVPCKIAGKDGRSSARRIINALQFASDVGARVVCLSWGGSAKSEALYAAMDFARSKGILIVCSSGNGHEDSDMFPRFPASYSEDTRVQRYGWPSGSVLLQGLDNLLCVASTTRSDNAAAPRSLAQTSNYGSNTVELAAEGERQVVADHSDPGKMVLFSGTSAAAAKVAGALGYLLAKNPGFYAGSLSPDAQAHKLKWALLNCAKPDPQLELFVLTGGVLDTTAVASGTIPLGPRIQPHVMPGSIHVSLGEGKDVRVVLEPSNGFSGTVRYTASVIALPGTSPSGIPGLTVSLSTAFHHPSARVVMNVKADSGMPKGMYAVKVTAHPSSERASDATTLLKISVH